MQLLPWLQDITPSGKHYQSGKPQPGTRRCKIEFYAILLIEECPDSCCCCGRKYYDYSNATMVFLTPGEIFRMSENNTLPNKGYLLAFHPDLLFRTSLNNHIKNYTFFSYKKEEALHLSQRETSQNNMLPWKIIEDELHHPIDTHSSTILSRHIELLLDYCTRYYERQLLPEKTRIKHSWTKWKNFSSTILHRDNSKME